MHPVKISKGGRMSRVQNANRDKLRGLIRQLSPEERDEYFDKVYHREDLEDAIAEVNEKIFSSKTPPVEKVEPVQEPNPEPIKEEIMSETTNSIEEASIVEESSTVDTAQPVESSSFSPLSEEVKQRSYNIQESNVNPADIEPIPEPSFEASPETQAALDQRQTQAASDLISDPLAESLSADPDPSANANDPQPAQEQPREKIADKITNDAVNELDPKEKKMAVKQLVTTVLDGYEMLHMLGQNYVKYDESKLIEHIQKGELDPTLSIPVDENTTTTPVEYVQTYNNQAEETIKYDPEFGERVRPAMERVFAKKGWGMTDEQYLMTAFGKDIAVKAMMVVGMKKQMNAMMQTFITASSGGFVEPMETEEPIIEKVKPDSVTTPPPPPPVEDPTESPIVEHITVEPKKSEPNVPSSFTFDPSAIESNMEE